MLGIKIANRRNTLPFINFSVSLVSMQTEPRQTTTMMCNNNDHFGINLGIFSEGAQTFTRRGPAPRPQPWLRLCLVRYLLTCQTATRTLCAPMFSKVVCLFNFSPLPSGTYMLRNETLGEYPVYCHMTSINGCGGAEGWTLAIALDGDKV